MDKESKFDISPYENVYVNIRTVEERGVVYTGIDSLLDALYRKEGDVGEILETTMPRIIVKPLKEELIHKGVSVESVQEYLDGLKQALEKLQILSLEIAFDPTEETIAILTTWVRKNIGNAVIIQFSLDKTLLSGVRLSFEGRYKEINLAHIIDEMLQQQPQLIQPALEG